MKAVRRSFSASALLTVAWMALALSFFVLSLGALLRFGDLRAPAAESAAGDDGSDAAGSTRA